MTKKTFESVRHKLYDVCYDVKYKLKRESTLIVGEFICNSIFINNESILSITQIMERRLSNYLRNWFREDNSLLFKFYRLYKGYFLDIFDFEELFHVSITMNNFKLLTNISFSKIEGMIERVEKDKEEYELNKMKKMKYQLIVRIETHMGDFIEEFRSRIYDKIPTKKEQKDFYKSIDEKIKKIVKCEPILSLEMDSMSSEHRINYELLSIYDEGDN